MNRLACSLFVLILFIQFGNSAYADSVKLTWDANTSSGVAGYRVYRSEQKGVYTSGPLNGSTLIAGTSWTDSNVISNHTYYYVVRTVSTNSLESGNSGEVAVTPFFAHINFQPSGTTYPGYVADSGAAFGDRGNGLTYGWSQDNTTGPRIRNNTASPDLRYDTLVHMGTLNWEVAVPNGTYTVHVVVGDASYTDVVSKLTVEGTLTINGSTSSSAHWLQGTATVSVTDGKLTIGNLSGSYNKICFIDVSLVTTANAAPAGFSAHVDFQAPGTTYSGYVADVGAAFGSRGNGFTYGWSQDNTTVAPNVGPRTRGDSTSPDQRYDSLVHMGALSWEIAVPNGTYTVHVVVGDPSYRDVVSKLTVEGTLTIDGSTGSSARWLQATATVAVNDGRLTISNLSGSYNKICFVDISATTTSVQTPTVTAGTPLADTQPTSYLVGDSSSSSGSETALPVVQSGRIYADMQAPVSTGISIENPGAAFVTFDFYFTDGAGNEIYSGRWFIPGHGRVSALLNSVPFAPPPEIDLSNVRTFTFVASAPIGVTAVRGFTNERSEYLTTLLPIAGLNAGAGLPIVFPAYVTGDGWDAEIELVNPSNSVLSGAISSFSAADPANPTAVSLYEIAPRSALSFRMSGDGSIEVTPFDGTPVPAGFLIQSLHQDDITVSQTGIYPVGVSN